MAGVILVGIDGSESSVAALKWAAGQARLTGCSLEVVTAWQYPVTFGWAPAWPPEFDPAKEAAEALDGIVADALGGEPRIDVRQIVVEGHPAQVLVEASDRAEHLVVGSRGHGAFTGMLLGSVSEHCASSASCPVTVVRHRDDHTGAPHPVTTP